MTPGNPGIWDEAGTIDLEKMYGPTTAAAAYLYTKIRVEKTDDYLLMVNNDGMVDVWIDGKIVHQDHSNHPAAGWLRQKSLRLEQGNHTVLVRTRQNEAEDTDFQQNYWLFRLRIRSGRKRPAPIGGLECGKESGSARRR